MGLTLPGSDRRWRPLLPALLWPGALAVLAPRWRVVGRNATPAWRVRGLRFFSDAACTAQLPTRTAGASCAAPSHARVDGSALAGPLSRTPAADALGGTFWQSGRACPAGQDFCYVGFAWQSPQVELPGTDWGFSEEAGCHDAPRFSRARVLTELDVEPQCILLEQAEADSTGSPAEEVAVQYALRSAVPGKPLLWYTLAVRSGDDVAQGGLLRLRAPLAAPLPLGGNTTPPDVLVSPLTVVAGDPAPVLSVTCPACSSRTVAFLARLCDEDRKHAYGSALVGSGPVFSLTVDPTPLLGGEHFTLCLDLDGVGAESPLLETAVSVYASCASRAEPTALVRGACDAALVGPLANRVIPDTSITASSYLSSSPSYGLGRMWRSRLDFDSGTTWCAGSGDAAPYVEWDLGVVRQVAKVQTKGGSDGSPAWVTSYSLSYSVDGSIWNSPSAVHTANVDATALAETDLQPPIIARFVKLHVLGSSGAPCLRAELLGCQVLYLTCDSSCSSSSAAYAGTACDTGLTSGVQGGSAGAASPSENLVPLPASGLFGFPVDAAGLLYTTTYTICIDSDGPGALAFGDTLLHITILGFDPSYPPTVWADAGQTVALQCGGCSASTDAALADACTGLPGSAGLSGQQTIAVALAGSAPGFSAVLDTSGLEPGRHYRLCLWPDRNDITSGFHDAAQAVYVTGIRTTNFASLSAGPAQSFSFHCPEGCSSSSSVYLGSACDHTDFSGAHLAEAGLSTDAAPVSHLAGDAYATTLDATGLSPGPYNLCADLDGAGAAMAFGDTLVQMTVL